MNNIETIQKWIKEADAIIIGAGAGLSDAAGIHYKGEKFEKDFKEWIKKYGFKDLYTSAFYPFKTEEEKWAYWSKHIYYSYYERKHTKLYQNLYELIKDKNYFVITTNTDGQFINNGFQKEKVFEVQGSYSLLQCAIPCHKKLYNNEKQVKEWIKNIDKELKIPSNLVPKCPVCHGPMNVNLRCDDTFVEDENWNKMNEKYSTFLKKNKDKKLLLIEFGVGFNTPGIIRFPFEEMTYVNKDTKLIRFNNTNANIPKIIKKKSLSIMENIPSIIKSL